MSKPPLIDQEARDRFRDEWEANFAVSANAGSGKTTAISERLAAMALAPDGPARLRKTAVVTYTKKAAAQIEQRARQVLLRRITEAGSKDLSTTVSDGRWLRDNIPEARMEILDAAHLSNVERPDEFSALMEEFLIH